MRSSLRPCAAFWLAASVLGLAVERVTTGGEPPPPSKVASVEGITEYRLANGLQVLLFPDPSAAQGHRQPEGFGTVKK